MTVPNPPMTADYSSYYQSESQRQLANDIATQEYNASKSAGEAEDRALNRAKFAWQQTMDRAGLTGRFEDSWTFPSQKTFLEAFGTWMPQGPQPGQQTLAAQQQAGTMLGTYQNQQTQAALQQAFTQALGAAGATGYYTAPVNNNVSPSEFMYSDPAGQQMYLNAAGGDRALAAQRWAADASNAVRQWNQAHPQQAQRTLTAQEQDYTQWLRSTQEARGAQEQGYTQWLRAAQEARANQMAQQATAQKYLELLGSLRGPADWAKYQQVLGTTPGGMRDLTAAAMGQYIPGGGATTGYQPQAANLNTLQGDVAGYGQQGYSAFTPAGQIQQAAAQQPLQGQNQQANALGNGTNMYGAPEQNQMNLPAPNQIAPQSWNALAPSQREMIKGQYEAQGWYKPDVEALMNQALPKYAANAPSAGTWRLK